VKREVPDAPALMSGPYKAPQVKAGGALRCEINGPQWVSGYTDAPIPWPYYRASSRIGRRLFICGDLNRALRVEMGVAVSFWWGVSAATVVNWRRKLGITWLPVVAKEAQLRAVRKTPRKGRGLVKSKMSAEESRLALLSGEVMASIAKRAGVSRQAISSWRQRMFPGSGRYKPQRATTAESRHK